MKTDCEAFGGQVSSSILNWGEMRKENREGGKYDALDDPFEKSPEVSGKFSRLHFQKQRISRYGNRTERERYDKNASLCWRGAWPVKARAEIYLSNGVLGGGGRLGERGGGDQPLSKMRDGGH